uniref:Neurotransmitter-gated ion-channel ligand-binding domain-containing protein n=1 Tax=Setaria digitata TaxID=48799 RepID=A0A915Q741_9BILA
MPHTKFFVVADLPLSDVAIKPRVLKSYQLDMEGWALLSSSSIINLPLCRSLAARLLHNIQHSVTPTITYLFCISVLFAHAHAARELPDIPDRKEISDEDLKQFGINDEQRLFKHIIKNYDVSVRPVWNASTVVNVYMGLTLTHIFNIDERNQVLTLNVWVEQSWRDERIRWDPIEFGNISKLTLGTNARDFSRGFVDTNLHVLNNGDTQWAPPAKVYSICKLDVRYFPFDDQFCILEFGSWIYDQSQLDVQIMERYDGKNPFTRDSFIENGEWEIVANRTRKVVIRGRQAVFPTIVFELHLRRRVLYFIYNIIAPCFMLSMLTMMQFILPCESGEKITLGLTVLLAYSVFSFNIAENMPETSEVIPLIGETFIKLEKTFAIYLMGIMAISGLSVCLSVIVLNMRHNAERNCRPPCWLNFVAYRILGRLFGTTAPKMRQKKENSGTVKDLMDEIIMEQIENENNHDELVEEWNRISVLFDRHRDFDMSF